MTEIAIFLDSCKLKWDTAASRRDETTNYAIVVSNVSVDITRPAKHYRVTSLLHHAKLVIKRYTSNRGVEYIKIYERHNDEWRLVYEKNYIDLDEIHPILKRNISNEELIREVYSWI